VDVKVTNPFGTSATSSADRFNYGPTITKPIEPNYGSANGGTSVTLTGTNFNQVTAVKFGSNNATRFEVRSETEIVAVSPPGSGEAQVTVTTAGGTSPINHGDDLFSYHPTVSRVEPSSGPATGGTVVTISGIGIYPSTSAVKFGQANATSFEYTSEGVLKAVAPAGTGTVDVTVTTPEGTSNPSPGDHFTYIPIEKAEYKNWVVSGTITARNFGQTITLPEASTFNGQAEVNGESGSGSATGSVLVPPFDEALSLYGLFPATLGETLTQLGSLTGLIVKNEASGEETLTMPLELNLGINSLEVAGLRFPASCTTAEPISLQLADTLTREELLTKRWSFTGMAVIPRFQCQEGLIGEVEAFALGSLLTGRENPYSISIKAPGT
jgi:hypothetical protein